MARNLRRTGAAMLGAGALLAVGAMSPAAAQVEQDGLVNVNIGDVTILEDVNIALAARVAANVCGVNVSNVTVLATQVDADNTQRTVCDARGGRGPVTIEQN